ncbi:MAG: EAL domain-containing response regulator [Kaiparowitsia implicata GSE-PSE-MK54-09C]|nr:EAL domain-containing response regulator [Kaiparowitsia implicata GSE-PSE-MK54-09C]
MNSIKILILEDHPLQLAATASAVKSCGASSVLTATEGGQAFNAVKQAGGVDIVICDITMPGEDGLRFLRKAANAGLVKAVVLSSAIHVSMRQGIITMIRHLGLEFLGDLSKPVEVERLREMIGSYGTESRLSHFPALLDLVELPDRQELKRALKAGEFIPLFQPKIKVETGEIVGAEALARWLHPERGLLGVKEFLTAVEREGISDCLFWSVFEKVCQFKNSCSSVKNSMEISVNVTASTISSPSFPAEVREMLRMYRVPAREVKLELTETGFLTAPATTLENLVRLRLMGVGIAMDDFGAGYSSLSRLAELPFNEIKLDAIFIENINFRPWSASIIKSVAFLGRELGLDVVVEGVADEVQLEVVRNIGGCIVQGFYYSEPLTYENFLAYLDD